MHTFVLCTACLCESLFGGFICAAAAAAVAVAVYLLFFFISIFGWHLVYMVGPSRTDTINIKNSLMK